MTYAGGWKNTVGIPPCWLKDRFEAILAHHAEVP